MRVILLVSMIWMIGVRLSTIEPRCGHSIVIGVIMIIIAIVIVIGWNKQRHRQGLLRGHLGCKSLGLVTMAMMSAIRLSVM